MPRTGRPPRLRRDAIVDAARAIIEVDGVDQLTMRRVADKVGSSPMGIYRHVRDKDELLVDGCRMSVTPYPVCRDATDAVAFYERAVDAQVVDKYVMDDGRSGQG